MYDCMSCASKRKFAKNCGALEDDLPTVNQAITMAPMWTSTQIGGRLVYAAIAVPTCEDCLEVSEPTVEQRAAFMGLDLGRRGGN
jgi:hypothetical protein